MVERRRDPFELLLLDALDRRPAALRCRRPLRDEDLGAWAAGKLPVDRKRTIRRHLAGCRGCLWRLAEFRAALSAAPPLPSTAVLPDRLLTRGRPAGQAPLDESTRAISNRVREFTEEICRAAEGVRSEAAVQSIGPSRRRRRPAAPDEVWEGDGEDEPTGWFEAPVGTSTASAIELAIVALERAAPRARVRLKTLPALKDLVSRRSALLRSLRTVEMPVLVRVELLDRLSSADEAVLHALTAALTSLLT